MARRAIASAYPQSISEAIESLIPSRLFAGLAVHGNTWWTPRRLLLASALMSWREEKLLTSRFETVRELLATIVNSGEIPASYSGYAEALARWMPRMLTPLITHLQHEVRRLSGDRWKSSGWIVFAADGSRFEAPRTQANEAELKRAGKVKTAPQVFQTALLHLRTNALWDFRLGPERLTRKQAGLFFQQRWRIEVLFRSLKQTWEHSRWRSRVPRTVLAEQISTLLGFWIQQLLSYREFAKSKTDLRLWSPASARDSTRRMLRQVLQGISEVTCWFTEMGFAIRDCYVRRCSKHSRTWPRQKHDPPTSPPRLRILTDRLRNKGRQRLTAQNSGQIRGRRYMPPRRSNTLFLRSKGVCPTVIYRHLCEVRAGKP